MTTKSVEVPSAAAKRGELFRALDEVLVAMNAARDKLTQFAVDEAAHAAAMQEVEAVRAEVATLRAESKRLAEPLRTLREMRESLNA